ncbi:4'-phosphopantetheinyl transferase family protein, partial [Streptomyces sp. WM6386]|uniref:4'-phosphopantetheinyl transferase family protein n=1 Tax=Streptomyces sp. WM6386 TaxID=1415558 RepID=UPI000AD1661C
VLHGTGLHFSLSHSHGIALISIADAPLGVDVQRVPTLETVELCLPELHPAEQRELRALPDAEQPLAFGRLWTRKEAVVKAAGARLTQGLGLPVFPDTDTDTGALPEAPDFLARGFVHDDTTF